MLTSWKAMTLRRWIGHPRSLSPDDRSYAARVADAPNYMATLISQGAVAGLVDKKYAAQLRNNINPERASSTNKLSRQTRRYESEERRISRGRCARQCVANTYTLNNSFGSAVLQRAPPADE